MAFRTREETISRAIERVESIEIEDMTPLRVTALARLLAGEVVRQRKENEDLRAIRDRARDALRGNASETDEFERGWLAASAEILGYEEE